MIFFHKTNFSLQRKWKNLFGGIIIKEITHTKRKQTFKITRSTQINYEAS